MGRMLTLTKKVREEICNHLRGGVPFLSMAAAMAGVGKRTVERWMHLGREARKAKDRSPATRPYRRFRREVLRAKEEGKGRLVEQVVRSRHWRAKFSILSMTDPRFRKRSDVRHDGAMGLGVAVMDPGEARAALARRLGLEVEPATGDRASVRPSASPDPQV